MGLSGIPSTVAGIVGCWPSCRERVPSPCFLPTVRAVWHHRLVLLASCFRTVLSSLQPGRWEPLVFPEGRGNSLSHRARGLEGRYAGLGLRPLALTSVHLSNLDIQWPLPRKHEGIELLHMLLNTCLLTWGEDKQFPRLNLHQSPYPQIAQPTPRVPGPGAEGFASRAGS